MQFESLSEFLAMGGYGFYVWLSFGSCSVILLAIFLSSLRDSKKLRNEVRAQMRREERIKKAKQQEQV
ncbi:heme exporter protein CcmD [Pseudoalteromonas sp. JBTF-M23]|uniref:Heme exporter protein D n=1 Tax=Pseudoalteromonas caenipelagi TaxID=2726988 RepID=A0A849VGJ0_9GAMM|nr:heme exporter protein CcmD [Pseudoalteromonas caenipelagi]NOU50831.1 heme exporter protein CcmD [Pseudoalteromonas caenipelagi]